jgi:hypothetical protein
MSGQSGQPGWKVKLKRIAAGVQVPFAVFGAAQSPPPPQVGLPPAPHPVVRQAEGAPRTRVPESLKQLSENDRRLKKDLRGRAMADAERRQTTSQTVEPVKAADHRQKRQQRAAETSAGAVPSTAERADPARARRRSERSR